MTPKLRTYVFDLTLSVLFLSACGGASLHSPGANATRDPTFAQTPTMTQTVTPAPSDTHLPIVTATATVTVTPAPEIGSSWIRPADGMAMMYVPDGSFDMGGSMLVSRDAKPVHNVFLDAFWIDQTEVTNAMYASCVDKGICQPPSKATSKTRGSYYGNMEFANYPVIRVTWNDAKAYCEWADARLPSEAEWEKAAHGTIHAGIEFPWGAGISCADANFTSANCPAIGDTSMAGSHPSGASPYGALDMAGNVWEWVNDWYDPNYYKDSPTQNPTGPETGSSHVLRGGSYSDLWGSLITAYRFRASPEYSTSNIGFRCARSAK